MIERTFDTQFIREILRDPELSKRVTDKGDVDGFDPENQESLYYLLAKDGDKTIGFVLCHIFNNPVCYQAHANYLSKYWGSSLHKYSRQAADWMFKNTNAEKLVAMCPTNYPDVKKHVEHVGFTEEGCLTKSSMFDGKLYDNYIMGLSR